MPGRRTSAIVSLVAMTLSAVSPALADESQRKRLRQFGERAVYVVEGGRNPPPAYKQSDAYDRHNAIAKASALANSTYENRIIVSDILTADANRFGADLNTIGRTYHAGAVMLAGPHFESKYRVPLAIPEGPADRCTGVCLQAFQYCTFQTGAAPGGVGPVIPIANQINRYLTHNERWCMYWFFRRDLHVAIQNTLHAYQIGGLVPAPPVMPVPPGYAAIAAPGALPGGAVPAPAVAPGLLARAFSYFGDHLVAGNVTGAGVAFPAPGAAAVAAAARPKRNTYPYEVIALGTPVSFYSHNPKKPVGYFYDAKRQFPTVPGGLFAAAVLPPPGVGPVAVGGAPLAPLPPLPVPGGAAGPLCNDFLIQPGHQVPPLAALPGVPGVAGVGGVLPGANVHPALGPAPPGVAAWPPPLYKLYRPAGAATGCSDLDLKIYSPDLTHVMLQEVARLRSTAAAAAGGVAAPAAAPPNRIRFIAESYDLYWNYGIVILPPQGVTPARTLWMGDPPAVMPAFAAGAVAAVAAATNIALPAPALGNATATAADLADFDGNLTSILPLNESIVDNGKVHVFKNTVPENTGVYQVFPALAAFASTWTLALGREVDLKLEFSLAVPSYVNLPGGPIAVLYEDDPAEPSYRLAALPPRPNPPGGGAPGPGAPGAPGAPGGPGGPPGGPGGPGPAPGAEQNNLEENNENLWLENVPDVLLGLLAFLGDG